MLQVLFLSIHLLHRDSCQLYLSDLNLLATERSERDIFIERESDWNGENHWQCDVPATL